MARRDQYKSSVGFTDLLFNLLVGFVFLFIVAFILINPITKKQDVPKKAEWIIVIEWNETLNDDIDLWVQDPRGNTVAFVKKEAGVMNLEKDDLGHANDWIVDEYGERTYIPINREVVTLRGNVAGEFKVAAHVFSMRPKSQQDPDKEQWITVQVIKINPYRERINYRYTYQWKGQQISLVNFTLNAEGKMTGHNTLENNIITKKKPSAQQIIREN
jgi:hypothetical protein